MDVDVDYFIYSKYRRANLLRVNFAWICFRFVLALYKYVLGTVINRFNMQLHTSYVCQPSVFGVYYIWINIRFTERKYV